MSSPKHSNQATALASYLRTLADLADRVARDHHEIASAAPAASVLTPPAAGGEAATSSPAAAAGAASSAGLAASNGHAGRRGGKRAAIEAAVRANPTAAIEEIVAIAGCSRSHASMVRREIFPPEVSKKK